VAALLLAPKTDKPLYEGTSALMQNIFHNANGALKKQAARFKVYAYRRMSARGFGSVRRKSAAIERLTKRLNR
jgi:hypothetical protein